MDTEILATLTQFGTAGLIAWMWLTERRAGASRERDLAEAQDVVREQRVQLEQLLRVVGENTRAVGLLESGQRRLLELLERLAPAWGPVRAADAARTPSRPYTGAE